MNETTLFGLPSDGRVAVVEIFRTGLDDQGKPIRLTATVFSADRNKFVIRSQARDCRRQRYAWTPSRRERQ